MAVDGRTFWKANKWIDLTFCEIKFSGFLRSALCLEWSNSNKWGQLSTKKDLWCTNTLCHGTPTRFYLLHKVKSHLILASCSKYRDVFSFLGLCHFASLLLTWSFWRNLDAFSSSLTLNSVWFQSTGSNQVCNCKCNSIQFNEAKVKLPGLYFSLSLSVFFHPHFTNMLTKWNKFQRHLRDLLNRIFTHLQNGWKHLFIKKSPGKIRSWSLLCATFLLCTTFHFDTKSNLLTIHVRARFQLFTWMIVHLFRYIK